MQNSTQGLEKWKSNVSGVYKRKSQEIMVENKQFIPIYTILYHQSWYKMTQYTFWNL